MYQASIEERACQQAWQEANEMAQCIALFYSGLLSAGCTCQSCHLCQLLRSITGQR